MVEIIELAKALRHREEQHDDLVAPEVIRRLTIWDYRAPILLLGVAAILFVALVFMVHQGFAVR